MIHGFLEQLLKIHCWHQQLFSKHIFCLVYSFSYETWFLLLHPSLIRQKWWTHSVEEYKTDELLISLWQWNIGLFSTAVSPETPKSECSRCEVRVTSRTCCWPSLSVSLLSNCLSELIMWGNVVQPAALCRFYHFPCRKETVLMHFTDTLMNFIDTYFYFFLILMLLFGSHSVYYCIVDYNVILSMVAMIIKVIKFIHLYNNVCNSFIFCTYNNYYMVFHRFWGIKMILNVTFELCKTNTPIKGMNSLNASLLYILNPVMSPWCCEV